MFDFQIKNLFASRFMNFSSGHKIEVFYHNCRPVSVYLCVCLRIVTADVRLDEKTAKSSSENVITRSEIIKRGH